MHYACSIILLLIDAANKDAATKRGNKMFTKYNTEGYSDSDLIQLNEMLKEELKDIDQNSDEYQQIKKHFADEVASGHVLLN